MKRTRTLQYTTLLVGLVILLALPFMTGCNRIQGDQTPNQRPEVFFVNIPPDGHSTSFDPVVYWVGTDRDGLIEFYRYIVVRMDEMNGLDVDAFVQTELPSWPDSMWTYLEVSPDSVQTQKTVPMSASLQDPVRTYVGQYVFLQAFDDQGMSSPIIWKLFKRNDNPPTTEIRGANFSTQVFINSEQPGGLITGVRFNLQAEDPDEADSLFEFRYKVFGPFISDTVSATGSEWEELLDTYIRRVFVTNDAKVFKFGEGLADTIVDTLVDDQGDPLFDTTILVIDTITRNNFYGVIDEIFDIDQYREDSTTSGLYRPVDSSFNGLDEWVSNANSSVYRDSLYNLFKNEAIDTTVQEWFMMWAQCRDRAGVTDRAPDFTGIQVVDPKFERDVLIIDFAKIIGRFNAPVLSPTLVVDSAKDYWTRSIDAWASNAAYPHGGNIIYDENVDYVHINKQGDKLPLGKLLSYKIIVLYNDDVKQSGLDNGGNATEMAMRVYTAIDAGVNVWATWRAPLIGGSALAEDFEVIPHSDYTAYFGIEQIAYTGWFRWARGDRFESGIRLRIEDFIGALSLNLGSGWPDVAIDTANLHHRYNWLSALDGAIEWRDTIGAQPEVDWSVRQTQGTEPLYLYKSLYGPSHFLGFAFSFEGTPVAIRKETNLFRTAHFNFVPLGMDDASMQIVTDSVLNWLYEKYAQEPVASTRYPSAKINLSEKFVRENYFKRWETFDPRAQQAMSELIY